ncbi:hypothetical protein ACEZDB_02965 [Streptacidiphilus sp. N1-3]|uniref:Anti-sigma regulatory factor (Ser/Thr protein kinase) n=1 Tax=Streptacidiphilus alkalitolerans TaxID=3342712 RepID=A0ABV6WU96_9ACTN
MPSAGHTWRMPFPGLAEQAAPVREWVSARVREHAADEDLQPDADQLADVVLLAHELFIAVLATRPGKIEMTVSTDGPRVRVYAAGPHPLPLRSRQGIGIVQGLALARGSQDENRTIWAEMRIGVRP